MFDLITGLTDGLAPAFDGDVIDWAETHVKLPHSARSKDFLRDMAPWLNDILRACTDDTTRMICVRAPTGGAKTTLLEVLTPYIISQKPGPMQINGQTDDTAKDWAEMRLIPVLEACEPVAGLFPHNRHNKRKTAILFPHMPLLINGANMTSLQEKSMRYEYGDEVWQWKKGMIGEMKARHHDRWNRKTILVTQGWDDGHDMDGEWKSCTEFTWGFTCAVCGAWQKYLLDQIKYEVVKRGEEYLWNEIEKTVRYECVHCGDRTADTAKNRRALSDAAEYRKTSDAGMDGHTAFTYPAYAVWWIPWFQLVSEWLLANDAKKQLDFSLLRQFIQKRKAETWREESSSPEVRLMSSPYSLSDYGQGQQWDGEAFRFLTVDKQDAEFWLVARAWKNDGTSRLLAEGRIHSWAQIREIQTRMKINPPCVFVDAQHDTQEVYSHCAENNWTAIHGTGADAFVHVDRKGHKTYRPFSEVRRA